MDEPTTPDDDAGRRGALLGVDVGQVRVGLAASDPDGLLASPVATLARDEEHGSDLLRVAEEVRARAAVGVVVGLPRSLSGGEGPAAAKVRDFARRLARRIDPVPVRLCDERLTTVSAESMLRDRGRKGAARRAVVDQAAAVLILQNALDTERASGAAPGEIVEVEDE